MGVAFTCPNLVDPVLRQAGHPARSRQGTLDDGKSSTHNEGEETSISGDTYQLQPVCAAEATMFQQGQPPGTFQGRTCEVTPCAALAASFLGPGAFLDQNSQPRTSIYVQSSSRTFRRKDCSSRPFLRSNLPRNTGEQRPEETKTLPTDCQCPQAKDKQRNMSQLLFDG